MAQLIARMGNKPQVAQFEATRKQMKDSFVRGKLEADLEMDLPAPRKGLVSPVIDTNQPLERPQTPILVDFNANRFAKRIGRRSSSIVREAVAAYERKEEEKTKKQQKAPIQLLLHIAKRRAEVNSSQFQFEDVEMKSPVVPNKSKSVILTRSASVGKVIPPKKLILKLQPAKSKPIPVPMTQNTHNNSLLSFLKTAVSPFPSFPKSLDGQWTRPMRENSISAFPQQGLKATFSEMVRLREEKAVESRGSGAETNWQRRKKQREALPRSKSKV